MMLQLAYRLIVLCFAAFLVRYVWEEKNVWNQVGATVVLVLFVLRAFLWK